MIDEGRLTALEQRVNDLEVQLRSSTVAAADTQKPDSEVLWVLQGLRSRVEEPGAVLLAGTVRLPDGRTAQWQQGVSTDDLLGMQWEDSADVLTALGHPVRLRLIQQVLAGVATVQELIQIDKIGTSGQVYHHLRQLTATGWLRPVGGGRYEVPVARVVPLLTSILGAQR